MGVMEFYHQTHGEDQDRDALRKAMENIDAERLKRKMSCWIKEKAWRQWFIIESGLDPQYSPQGAFQGRISRITVPFWGLRSSMLI